MRFSIFLAAVFIGQTPDAVREWEQRLLKNPDDVSANLELGKHLCFQAGNWDQGLFHLAQGSDKNLRLLAQHDLAGPENHGDQLDLGEAWWDLAQTAEGAAKTHLIGRALFWYQKGLPKAEGLRRGRIEQRIRQFAVSK